MAPKVIPVKYFLYGGLIVLLAIALVFFYLYKKESKEKAMLLQKGIRGEAWVIDLYGRKTSRKSSPNYYMTVAFFADTASIKPVITDTAVSKAKNGPDMVDRLFNKIHAGDRPAGNYQTLTIAISSVEYNKYKKDDKVKIIYLKDDLTVVKLLEQVE
jgi:hypothetical protein